MPDRFDLSVGAVILVLLTTIVLVAAPAYAPRGQQVVYLGPVSGPTQDLYAVDPAGGAPRKLTDSQNGIIGYDVTPDGSKIVYSEVRYTEGEQTGITALYMWEAATARSTLRYECQGAACTGLKWRPDGGAFAFERIDMNTTVGSGAARTWIFDLAENTARPLFKDTQQLGYMPRWSPDGKRIAVFSVSAGGIVIHDFGSSKDPGRDQVVPAQQGEVGSFSPDGRWLSFPKIVSLGENQYAVHVMLVDLSSESHPVRPLIPDSEPVSDVEAVWRSDSQGLIVARQPPARKIAQGSALYSVDLATGAATLLVPDEGYEQRNLSVNGDLLVFERVALDDVMARPELWVYNLATRELKRIAQNGVFPRWLRF